MVFGLHLDELGDFEQNWKANADKYFPGRDKGSACWRIKVGCLSTIISSSCHSYLDVIHENTGMTDRLLIFVASVRLT